MLEFIVLGEIPGTSVHITYAQVLIFAAVLLIASEIRLVGHRKEFSKTAQAYISRLLSTLHRA